MHANKENLLFYNSLYEKHLRKKFRGQNKQKKPITINRSRSRLDKFCCFKCTRRAKLKAEEIVIPVVEYSEGESGEEENRLGRKFLKMKEREKDQHTRRLWARLLVKAKGASLINLKFEGLKRRMYLFGTSTKLKFEIGPEDKVGWYIIMPQSRVRTVWNFVVLWLLGYTATIVPYRTAFIEREDETNNFLPMFDIFVDFMYTVDLVLNFFMAFEDKDKKLETRMKMIAVNYFQTWFPLDFLACIPFQYLEPGSLNTGNSEQAASSRDESGNLARLAKLPRMYKLLKIVRLFKLVRLMKYNRSINRILNLYNMNEGIKRLIQVLFWMLFLVHLMGCLFFLVAKFDEFRPATWVSQNGLIDTEPSRQYLFSVNWALQTLTTVGYGDITAGTLGEKITAIIWMIGGVGFYSYTIGGLASMIADIDKREA